MSFRVEYSGLHVTNLKKIKWLSNLPYNQLSLLWNYRQKDLVTGFECTAPHIFFGTIQPVIKLKSFLVFQVLNMMFSKHLPQFFLVLFGGIVGDM